MAATVGAVAALVQAAPVRAAETAPVDTVVDSLIAAVKNTGDFIKASIGVAETGVQVLKEGYEVAAPVIKQGYEAVSPYVNQAVDAASPTFKAALPGIVSAEKAFEASIKSDALDQAVSATAKAVTVVTPVAKEFVSTLSTYDSTTLGEVGLGLVAFTYLAPALFGGLAGLTRGYASDVSAAQVLDFLGGDAVLVDIRTQSEKESSGLPDVPSSAGSKYIEVEFAFTEDKKLRNALRDPNSIEAIVTALQIASLKRLNKGSKIILLDRYGPQARAVAKEITRKGFGNVVVVEGGFDGRTGWVQTKLQIKPAATFISAPAPALGTMFSRKALPAPKKA